MMASATDLAWDECPDADFDYFAVYGSDVPILDLTAVVVGYTIDTEMDVTGADFDYYHVTATDFAGNEGDASSIANTYAGASADVNLPQAFALKANRPNPFTLARDPARSGHDALPAPQGAFDTSIPPHSA